MTANTDDCIVQLFLSPEEFHFDFGAASQTLGTCRDLHHAVGPH